MLRSVLARVAGCCALAVAVTTPAMAADPLVVAESRFSVAETIDRLAKDLESKGIKVVARIDHAAGPKSAGLQLPPTQVLVFGNPKLGTPLMQANPMVAIDLPMRVLAWQDAAGKVRVGYAPPANLKARYAITGKDAVFETMAKALAGLTKAASGAK